MRRDLARAALKFGRARITRSLCNAGGDLQLGRLRIGPHRQRFDRGKSLIRIARAELRAGQQFAQFARTGIAAQQRAQQRHRLRVIVELDQRLAIDQPHPRQAVHLLFVGLQDIAHRAPVRFVRGELRAQQGDIGIFGALLVQRGDQRPGIGEFLHRDEQLRLAQARLEIGGMRLQRGVVRGKRAGVAALPTRNQRGREQRFDRLAIGLAPGLGQPRRRIRIAAREFETRIRGEQPRIGLLPPRARRESLRRLVDPPLAQQSERAHPVGRSGHDRRHRLARLGEIAAQHLRLADQHRIVGPHLELRRQRVERGERVVPIAQRDLRPREQGPHFGVIRHLAQPGEQGNAGAREIVFGKGRAALGETFFGFGRAGGQRNGHGGQREQRNRSSHAPSLTQKVKTLVKLAKIATRG